MKNQALPLKPVHAIAVAISVTVFVKVPSPLAAQGRANDLSQQETVRFPVGRFEATMMGIASNAWTGANHKNNASHVRFVLEIDETGRISADVDYELPEDDKASPSDLLRYHSNETLEWAKKYRAAYYYRLRFKLSGTIDAVTGRAVMHLTEGRMETGQFRGHQSNRGGWDRYVDWHHEFEQDFFGWFIPGPRKELLVAKRVKLDRATIDHVLATNPKYYTSGHFELDDGGYMVMPGPWIVGGPGYDPEGKGNVRRTRSAGHKQTTRPRIEEVCFTTDSTKASQELDPKINHGFSLRILAPLSEAPKPESRPIPPVPAAAPRPSPDAALKMSVRLIPPDPKADLDGDGEITAADARLIREAEEKRDY